MVNIKRFIDRVSILESKPGRDLVISSQEAKMLRDEIAKLLADNLELHAGNRQETIDVQINGGRW